MQNKKYLILKAEKGTASTLFESYRFCIPFVYFEIYISKYKIKVVQISHAKYADTLLLSAQQKNAPKGYFLKARRERDLNPRRL
jgi:hypothetical protein